MIDYESLAQRLETLERDEYDRVILDNAAAALRELRAERDRLLAEIEEILVSQEC